MKAVMQKDGTQHTTTTFGELKLSNACRIYQKYKQIAYQRRKYVRTASEEKSKSRIKSNIFQKNVKKKHSKCYDETIDYIVSAFPILVKEIYIGDMVDCVLNYTLTYERIQGNGMDMQQNQQKQIMKIR